MTSINWKDSYTLVRIFLILSIVILAIKVEGQSTLQWAKSFGGSYQEETTAVCADDSGNSYVAGQYLHTTTICDSTLPWVVQTISSNWTMNIFISKFDNLGNCLWVKPAISIVPPVGGGAMPPNIHEIEYYQGKLYCVGTFMDTLKIDNLTLSNPSCVSFCETRFVMSLDATTGAADWGKPFLGTSGTSGSPLSIECYDHGLFVAGNFDTQLQIDTVTLFPTSFSSNGCLLKFNHNGICEWGKNIGTGTTSSVGSMVFDDSHSLYLTGIYSGTITFGQDSLDDPLPAWAWPSYLAKYDTTGNLTWVKGGSSEVYGSFLFGELTYGTDGFVYYTALFEDSARFDTTTIYTNSNGYSDALVKMDSTGQFVWVKKVGHRASNKFSPSSISSNANGFVLFSGFTDSVVVDSSIVYSNGDLDFLLTQYDHDGNVLYYKNFGGPGQAHPEDVFCQGNLTYFVGGSVGNYYIDSEYISNLGAGDALIGLIADRGDPVSIDEGTELQSPIVYPNPSEGTVRISSAIEIDQIIVQNSQGKTLMEAKPQSFDHEITIRVAGMYYLTTISGSSRVTTKVVVVD